MHNNQRQCICRSQRFQVQYKNLRIPRILIQTTTTPYAAMKHNPVFFSVFVLPPSSKKVAQGNQTYKCATQEKHMSGQLLATKKNLSVTLRLISLVAHFDFLLLNFELET